MKILLIGSGGREHVIADAIARSRQNPELYAVMSRKNPGTARLCKDFLIADESVDSVIPYARSKGIDVA
ncbi:MAG: phosphoribosylamine--glycine ligase, partial [ANME-2 cluster archaeon]